MARTQQHSPKAALETFLIFFGWKSGFFRYGRILAITLAGMLSRSKLRRLSRKPMSLSMVRLVTQKSILVCPVFWSRTLVGPSPLRMHTASITSFTGPGGLFMPFTSEISFFVSVSRAFTASLRAGMACSRSASHSALMACTFEASSLALASSTLTTDFTLSASTVSAAILSMSSLVSLELTSSWGLRAVSSSCISATCCAVDSSFSSPTSYLVCFICISFCLEPLREM
mmetsp:Transcript_13252/g.37455  ORF Transcript_13252/g.37455 Transcript_13252/m.37455 type:complete len:229 (-) Transcript_13252:3772-4458(-)